MQVCQERWPVEKAGLYRIAFLYAKKTEMVPADQIKFLRS